MWQSGPWKLDLLRMVDRCERQFVQMGRLRGRTWWEDAVRGQQVEKAVFLPAFIVRKLAESSQLSVQVQDSEIAVVAFPIRSPGLQPDSLNWEQLDRFYDLSAGAPERVRLRDLTNWIIHSYVFVPEVRSDHAGSSTLTGFYCNSDRLLANRLLRVAWSDYRAALQAVAHDDIVHMVTVRDGRGRKVQLRSATPIRDTDLAAFYARHRAFIEEAHGSH